ncbi:MAG: hypothetical protein ACQEVT_09105 [Pseudomonadota bacterium]|uniref:hypothetical protein n=1 Tax=Roseovarius TaxID=74030 RepID=UPI0022A8B564|nr:hypothetical protein [Roseovarius sp. EGI FJ00037]MCZ0813046.1 hypothetical protein [Roseovarius sp. EGI FJ00037]
MHPALAATEQRKAGRGDRVLIDSVRTFHAQTAVASNAAQARQGAARGDTPALALGLFSDMVPDTLVHCFDFPASWQTMDPWPASMRIHRTSQSRPKPVERSIDARTATTIANTLQGGIRDPDQRRIPATAAFHQPTFRSPGLRKKGTEAPWHGS